MFSWFLVAVVSIMLFLFWIIRTDYKYFNLKHEWWKTHRRTIDRMHNLDHPISEETDRMVLEIRYDTLRNNKTEHFMVHRSFNKLPNRVKQSIVKDIISECTFDFEPVNLRFHTAC